MENDGTYCDNLARSLTPSALISRCVSTVELMGWWRSSRPSLGCDTTTTSSKSITFDVSFTSSACTIAVLKSSNPENNTLSIIIYK